MTDTSIMAGKNKNIGLRAEALPEVRYSVLIPTIAAIMAMGRRRANGFAGVGFGSSGGGSTTIWPPGITGGRAADRVRRSIAE
ncbi:MAG: hypothetical protein K0U70_13485 [Actinomycetia bacterium]|nr:hypothetical protein [Actinomycetes bacterium]